MGGELSGGRKELSRVRGGGGPELDRGGKGNGVGFEAKKYCNERDSGPGKNFLVPDLFGKWKFYGNIERTS